jgi:hypothetical protein
MRKNDSVITTGLRGDSLSLREGKQILEESSLVGTESGLQERNPPKICSEMQHLHQLVFRWGRS